MKLEKKLASFLKAFTERLTDKQADNIDFILLIGSAVSGEFVPGSSDVDLIIQTTKEEAVEPVEKEALQIFWELAEKYNELGFKKSLSIAPKESLLEKLISQFEQSVFLYKPLFVFGPNDIEWGKGRFHRLDLIIGGGLIASQLTIFNKIKNESKLLYGRDIRPEIRPQLNIWERVKALLTPFYLATGALLVLPFSIKNALRWSSKAVLYELDSALYFLDLFLADREEKIKKLKEMASIELAFRQVTALVNLSVRFKQRLLQPSFFSLFKQAVKYKRRNYKAKKWPAVVFVLRAFFFITVLNNLVFIRRFAWGMVRNEN